MATDVTSDYEFAHELNESLAAMLSDVSVVRQSVERLVEKNSFRESCFCKGLVLPVVDAVATRFLTTRCRADRHSVFRALRCEGYATPMYSSDSTQVGFSSYSRSNSYHPGDKSGRRTKSRRSPDFCIRHPKLRMLGEVKYVPARTNRIVQQVMHELRDYLAIKSEPTSDWGHEFGFGLIYDFGGDGPRRVEVITDYWESDRIYLTVYCRD